MATTLAHARRGHFARTGAPLAPPVVSYAVLTLLAVIVPAATGSAPWTSDSALLDFFTHHSTAARASAFFVFGSAIPFAVLTAVATSRLRTLGLDVPGRIIAQLGGVLGAAMLAVSGLVAFALTRPHVADSAGVTRGLYALSFAAGGPGFVAFSGLLVAGISIAGLMGRVLPRWLGWSGIAVAVVSELGTFAVATSGVDALLPIGRFGGLAWLVAISVLLPSSRRELRARRGEVRAADLAS